MKTRDAAKQKVATPADLMQALAKNAGARERFDQLPRSHQKEYLEWIGSAKQDETRARRIAKAIEMIAKGGRRK